MPSTTVKVPQTVMVDVEVEHKFAPGDVVFHKWCPEEPDEEIVSVQQYRDLEALMYYFKPRPGGTPYGRGVEFVDKNYLKARP